jgi:hypothetical protein
MRHPLSIAETVAGVPTFAVRMSATIYTCIEVAKTVGTAISELPGRS